MTATTRKTAMKKAFSLVELLVVIGIIGILSAVLLVATGGIGDRARAVKCAANLRSLAAAVNSYASGGVYPFAQSAPVYNTDVSSDGLGISYSAAKGWVSWLDEGAKYPSKSEPRYTQPSYAGTVTEVRHALTNGAIWRAIGGRSDCYRCPVHVKACQNAGVDSPGWSYQMNAYFGYDEGTAVSPGSYVGASLDRADRRLLFAEIPAVAASSKIQSATGVTTLPEVRLTGGSGDAAMDGCLRYSSSGGTESIGFNHQRGKQLIGHVAFADGHIESIAAPKNGGFVDLTDWLCQGKDVVFVNGNYQKANDNSVE